MVDELVDLVRTAHADATTLATRKDACIGEAAAIEKLALPQVEPESSGPRADDASDPPHVDAKAIQDDIVPSASPSIKEPNMHAQPIEDDSATLKLTKARESMSTSLELLTTALEVVEAERKEWWMSDAKKKQRQQWGEEGNTKNLARQQAVNNTCVSMLSEMGAVIGSFKRWVMA